jgi:adenosylmethionine-8-amino-7-oxononanoate aminotransferase
LRDEPLEVIAAQGQYLTLSTGQRIFDACGGAAVSCIGHGDPRVCSAITAQIQSVDYVHSWLYTTRTIERLSKLILRDQFSLTHALFVSSGSEAVESALKLCRQYFVELEGIDTPRTQFISRRQSYHGTTLGALSIGGNMFRRRIFEPLLDHKNIHQISPCYPYRYQNGSEEEYTDVLIQELIDVIEDIGPEKVVAFIFEPVAGAALGCVPATADYLIRVRQVCDRYRILMVYDEVMCGMGRCSDGSSLHAWKSLNSFISEENVAPDIQTVGKGLGGGYTPIAAVLVSKRVESVLASGTGSFVNGFTYQAHPTTCAAALAVQTIIQDDKLLPQVAELGITLERLLRDVIAPLPYVGDIRGKGLLWGVEFVRDKNTKATFELEGACASVARAAFSKGVHVYVCMGVADGKVGDAILLAPAFNCLQEDIKMMVNIVAESIIEKLPYFVVTSA